jgi:hypothetical protein
MIRVTADQKFCSNLGSPRRGSNLRTRLRRGLLCSERVDDERGVGEPAAGQRYVGEVGHVQREGNRPGRCQAGVIGMRSPLIDGR